MQAGFVMTLGMNVHVMLRNGSPWDINQPAYVEGDPHLPGFRIFCHTACCMKVQCQLLRRKILSIICARV